MKKSNTESLSDLLSKFLRQEGLETPLNQHRLISAWSEVMGTTITRYTGDMFIKNRTLYVKITSPSLKSDLMMERAKLVKRLNDYVGAYVIADIVFI